MKVLFFYVILLSLKIECCNNANQFDMNCNQQKAQATTDKLIEKKGNLKVSEMNVKIEKDSLHFVIEYLPKDTMMLGGGGKFKVLKSDCKIVEQKFYQ